MPEDKLLPSDAHPVRKRLDRDDWLEAGLVLAGKYGLGALKIDVLCQHLNVTKGSFYWHFSGRQELIDQLLDHWYGRETENIIARVETVGGSARQRLMALFQEGDTGRVNFGAELAIRHWARSNRDAAAVVRRVDRRRLDYVTALFEEDGTAAGEARSKAIQFNAIILGDALTFRREDHARRQQRQEALIEALLQS